MEITEYHIEQFIRFPEELTLEEHKEIEQALASNAELRSIAQFFRKFYAEFDKITGSKTQKSAVIRLEPMQYQPDSGSKGRLILAAMSPAVEQAELRTVATFTSAREETVLRLLYNIPDQEYQLHLISNTIPDDEMAILSINALGVEMIVGETRKQSFRLQDDEEEYRWDEISCELYRPVGSFSVKPSNGEVVEDNGYRATSYQGEDELVIDITESGGASADISRAIVKSVKRGTQVISATKGRVTLPGISGEEQVRVWLYK
jgi:hypothetical protein